MMCIDCGKAAVNRRRKYGGFCHGSYRIMDKAKALMREELANVSYTTWIEQPLKPV